MTTQLHDTLPLIITRHPRRWLRQATRPAATSRLDRGAPADRSVSLAGVLGFLVVAVLLGMLTFAVLRADQPGAAGPGASPVGPGADPVGPAAAAAGCETQTEVRVATTAEFAPVVEAAAERLAGNAELCASYDITTAPAGVTAEQIGAGTDLPHAWIPDSDIWVDQANQAGAEPALAVGPTLATSPVVLAVPSSLAQLTGNVDVQSWQWQAILNGPLQLRVADPVYSTTSLLALDSATRALSSTSPDQQLLLAAASRMSQEAAPETELFAQASEDAEEATAVPASEQQIVRQRTDGPGAPLPVVVPAEGIGALSYSWVVLPEGNQDDATREAVDTLGVSLLGVAGLADLTEAGFRTGRGEEILAAPGIPEWVTVTLPPPALSDTEALLAAWDAAAVAPRSS